MNRTRDLLRRAAGGVEPRKDASKKDGGRSSSNGHHAPASPSPRKSSHDSGNGATSSSASALNGNGGDGSGSRYSSNDDDKRWRQRITDTKLFKRLMQPTLPVGEKTNTSRRRASTEGIVPRLGEVPARSKYFRAEQERSHFANTEDYLPLAEMCGPPPSSQQQQQPMSPLGDGGDESAESPDMRRRHHHSGMRHHHSGRRRDANESDAPYEGLEDFAMDGEEVDVEVDDMQGDMPDMNNQEDVDFVFEAPEDLPRHHDRQQQQQHQVHTSQEGGLRENLVRAIPGSVHRRNFSSTGSCASAASSVGPTGLALLPQFRWVPRPGGGGHGFNPFTAFRRHQQQQQYLQQPMYYEHMQPPATPETVVTPASHRSTGVYPMQPDVHPPHEDVKMTATLSAVGDAESSFNMFYGTPSPASKRSCMSPQAQSFYGPIGSLGIEASRVRRRLELETGEEGDAEKAYKARTSRRPSRFSDDTILLITKAWCDPDMLLTARVVDSPLLPADGEEDTSSTDSFSAADWESASDDEAGGKPPVYDAATMAAREARVRKQRIRQERRRNQPAESPSFYFAGDELAALRLPDEKQTQDQQEQGETGAAAAAAGPGVSARKATTPATTTAANAQATRRSPSPAARARQPSPASPTAASASRQSPVERAPPSKMPAFQAKVAVAAAAAAKDGDDELSASDSSKSSENNNSSSSSNDDDDEDSSSGSGSESVSDNSSRSESDEDDDANSVGNRSPLDDAHTRAPSHGQRSHPPQQQRKRMSQQSHPEISFSTGPGAAVGRSVTAHSTAYDFMNNSMMDGPGGSLFLPHDDNEMSVVPAAVLTPLNRAPNASSPLRGAPPAPPKSPAASAAAAARGQQKEKPELTERRASGSGTTAAHLLRESQKNTNTAGGSTATTGATQQPQSLRREQNPSTNSDDLGVEDMSVYGSSFHLRDGRGLASPAEEDAADSPHTRAPTESPMGFSTVTRVVMSVTPAVPSANAPSRNPTVSPSLFAGNTRRLPSVSPAGMSMETSGYGGRPSSLVPGVSPSNGGISRAVSLTPQPPLDGRQSLPATPGNHRTANVGPSPKGAAGHRGGYYTPTTPPRTPSLSTPTRGYKEGNAAAAPRTRAAANMSVTPGLGDSTHFPDNGYELPEMP